MCTFFYFLLDFNNLNTIFIIIHSSVRRMLEENQETYINWQYFKKINETKQNVRAGPRKS